MVEDVANWLNAAIAAREAAAALGEASPLPRPLAAINCDSEPASVCRESHHKLIDMQRFSEMILATSHDG